MDQYIGKFLDNRYELLEMIGSGGMAQVYRARCHRLNRLVAVKILRSDLARDADFRRRFHDESQAVAMLSHPNIVSVYDVSRSGEIEYIVMELIDGITLKQYMKQKGTLNWRESLHFITQIMKGLSHAHGRGIIHRDIKPHNIMVLRDGSVKVADFGIARLASSAQSTITQEALGSVHYISPEQAKGSRIDARSDIYSAGVVLYEMTTGRLPYEGESAVSVAIQHINSMPLSPRELNPDIPEALETITLKAMSPNPDNRYSSADEMLADLEEFRKNPGINFDYQPKVAEEIPDEPTRRMPVGGRTEGREEREHGLFPKHKKSDRGGLINWGSNKTYMIASIIGVLIFVIGVSYFLWIFFFSGLVTPTEDLEVPSLIGMSLAEAEAKYQDFRIVEGETVPNDTYAKGLIVDQDPGQGDKAKKNAEITVTISAGSDSVEVPNLVNKEYRVAREALDTLGLLVDPEYQPSDTVTDGYVISTTPTAGTSLSPGDTVHLVISTGPDNMTVVVPTLVGMTEEKARQTIEELGLKVGSVTPVASNKPAGEVVYQSAPAASQVPQGTTIYLQVSMGSAASAEPSDVPETETPAPSASQTKSKTVTVNLPSGDGTVHVVLLYNGNTVYEQTVNRSLGTIYPSISGTGSGTLQIYFDGTLSSSSTISFD